ncbi:MAG: hypothetical protein IPN13_10910 [Bacteroidetes bacterium]|nr:hypothetical protein [Bacteroidota bacterium]
MNFLERKYYGDAGNAAALKRSIINNRKNFYSNNMLPVLRPTNKKGIKINYISTKQLPPESLIEKKTGNRIYQRFTSNANSN